MPVIKQGDLLSFRYISRQRWESIEVFIILFLSPSNSRNSLPFSFFFLKPTSDVMDRRPQFGSLNWVDLDERLERDVWQGRREFGRRIWTDFAENLHDAGKGDHRKRGRVRGVGSCPTSTTPLRSQAPLVVAEGEGEERPTAISVLESVNQRFRRIP